MDRLDAGSATIRRLAVVLLCVALPAACGPKTKVTTPVRQVIAERPSMPPPYIIGPGDELEVVFFHTPDLNIETPVRPDGYISMPLAHDVRAVGRTPEELRTVLTQAYAKELKQPEIAVVVRAFAAYKVHIGGEVKNPGVYPLNGTMTVLDGVLQAGIHTRTAKLDEIIVIRPDAETRSYKIIPVDLTKVLDGTDTSQNIPLGPFDAVFVATSHIADVNTWVDLYIRQNIPIDIGLRFGTISIGGD